jgi:hypothetical protein
LKLCCRVGRERGSSVGNSWQEQPQKSVLPLGRDPSLIIAWRNFDRAFEPAMVDLHGDDPHWFAGCRERELLLLQGFRCFAIAPDPDSARLHFDFYLVGFNSGQFNTDPEARGTLKDVDRRTPLNSGIAKIGEVDLRYLVGDLANLALEKPQTERTGFSAHHPQWMRWPREATSNSSGIAGKKST